MSTSDGFRTFTIVTFNVGLLSIFGGRVEPVPFIEERLSALPAALLKVGADAVTLQEIYAEPHCKYLAAELKEVYPYSSYVSRGRFRVLESGLMTLSRNPLRTSFEPFRAAPLDEKLACKGVLTSIIELGAIGAMVLINVHTTAGGLFAHPEGRATNLIRTMQIRQLLRVAKTHDGGVIVIAGDMNCGPGVSQANYQQFLESGFADVYKLVHAEREDATWDPKNVLNQGGPHRNSPPQRVDHIFLQNSDLSSNKICPVGGSVIFKDAVVRTPDGGHVTLSDHFGLCVAVNLKTGATGSPEPARLGRQDP